MSVIASANYITDSTSSSNSNSSNKYLNSKLMSSSSSSYQRESSSINNYHSSSTNNLSSGSRHDLNTNNHNNNSSTNNNSHHHHNTQYGATSPNPYYATNSAMAVGGATAVLNDTGVFYEHKVDEKSLQSKIDQLELLTTVGTGTFGRVIAVKHKQTDDYYALKIMSIAEVLRLKQTEHVKNEKDILTQVKHPFIINLYWTCHSERFLYMLLEYVCGGELFSYLRNAVKFSNDTAVFYAAEITSALEYLHSLSIIYRDLKPENLLLDKHGHIRICDFGFAKKVHDRTWTLCGTPEYLAPEIIQGKGHHKAVDYWALGILIYEMLAGYPPFYDENPFQIYQKILAGKIEWPRYIDLIAKDLIKKLLVSDRTKRLGTMRNGADDIKRHKWFKNINWDIVALKKLEPPIVPKVTHDGDTKNFDKYDEDGWKDVPLVSSKNLQPFEDF